MLIEELVKRVLSEIRQMTKTETVVGDPIKIEDTTLVPVSKVSIGFGVGGGKMDAKESGGEATGGGLVIEPVAFIVIRDDNVNLITMKKDDMGLGKIIDLIPQIADKVKNMKKKKNISEQADEEKR